MFEIYDYRYEPVFDWGSTPEEPYLPPPPSQLDPTWRPDGSDTPVLDWPDFEEPPLSEEPPLTDGQLDQLEEAFNALDVWLINEYGEGWSDGFLLGIVTLSDIENDFRNDLLAGKADAWIVITEAAEAVFGIKDIQSNPNLLASVVMWVLQIVSTPVQATASEADDESGSEEDDGTYDDDGDSFVFEDWDDDDWEDDDGDDWSVTIEADNDTGDGGRDL